MLQKGKGLEWGTVKHKSQQIQTIFYEFGNEGKEPGSKSVSGEVEETYL